MQNGAVAHSAALPHYSVCMKNDAVLEIGLPAHRDRPLISPQTALYQTLTPGARSTSPTTQAPSQIRTSASVFSLLIKHLQFLLSLMCAEDRLRRGSELRRKVAVYKDRNLLSVMGGAQDAQIRCAHHEVHVGDGIVEAPAFSSSLFIRWPPSRQGYASPKAIWQAAFSSKRVL